MKINSYWGFLPAQVMFYRNFDQSSFYRPVKSVASPNIFWKEANFIIYVFLTEKSKKRNFYRKEQHLEGF